MIKRLAIIPARKNSKRILNKNRYILSGRPILYYALDSAKKSKLFSRIIVSTDSKKIANIARKNGAEVPFIRNKKLSNDYTASIILHVDNHFSHC